MAAAGEPVNALAEGIRQARKVLIDRAIEQANGNYTKAAKLLAAHANLFFRLIRTLTLKGEASAMTAKSFMTVNQWQSLTNGSEAISLPDI